MIKDPDGLEISRLQALTEFRDRLVLEIGCGDGRLASFLSNLTNIYLGIDTDAGLLKSAHAKAAFFCAGSGEKMPVPDNYFHLLLFTLSLHHQNGERALAEAFRVLRPGGHLVVVEPCADGQIQQLFNLFNDESAALLQARQYMEQGPFRLCTSEIVETEWIFKDRDELLQFDFDNGGRCVDSSKIKQMQKIIGRSLLQQPIRAREKLEFFLLSKII